MQKLLSTLLIFIVIPIITTRISALDEVGTSTSALNDGRRLYTSTPGIVWLLSFPGSGTTYTEMIIQDSTGYTTANNYGTGRYTIDDNTKVMTDTEPKQLYDERVNGPFLTSDLKIPNKYIITRTHCLNTCYDCPPINYISRGHFWFYTTCLMGTKYDPTTKANVNVQYSGELVHKAMHMIRDPFSNIVSRFLKHFKWRSGSTVSSDMIVDITNDKQGFQEYCRRLDEKFYKQEIDMFPEIMGNNTLMKDVPCRSEFYKYTQWHNLAYTATKDMHPMPIITLHYEEYCKDLDGVLNSMLDFIELDDRKPEGSFNLRLPHCHNYVNFFDDHQLIAIETFIRHLAEPYLLSKLIKYFNLTNVYITLSEG